MQKQYEIPELTLIGQAEEVVQGVGGLNGDLGMESMPEFELEQDEPAAS
jgi:hypothetical protein